ncbi:Chloride Channel (ClC) Family [Achlya hypogyna]|uniref:Chloride Channel (ClC) Family n=1 Tax=Achlya hypogyna TaxID=1202772 RepID=A0A1V9ZBT7_ACHHY|nr:Chloride Channel (ClC) Family [Achlya hypogyna]
MEEKKPLLPSLHLRVNTAVEPNARTLGGPTPGSTTASRQSRQWRFSVVEELASPVLRDDFDEIPWDAKQVSTTPHEFAYNPQSTAPRLRSRTNSLGGARTPIYGTANVISENEDETNVFDGAYHSMYISPHPKGAFALSRESHAIAGWRGIVVLLQSPVLLVLIGLFSAFLGYLLAGHVLPHCIVHLCSLWLDAIILRVTTYHQALSSDGFGVFLLFSLAAGCLGSLLVHFVSPEAAGSGLPQMKVALSGVDMTEYLSARCLVVKMAGLVTAYAAALSIGKEGPFIMISCCFAECLMQMDIFRRIHDDSAKRLEMLACACAAGVAATFGTPFGGVLFAVEVTSSFYMVRNLPRSFFAALAGSITISFLMTNGKYGLFDRSAGLGLTETDFTREFTSVDMCIFVFIGVVCGILGAVFIFVISMLVRARDRWFLSSRGPPLLYKRLGIVVLVTLIANIFDFYGDPAWFLHHGSPQTIINTLFTKAPSREEGADLARSLITFFPLKYILTMICVVVPLPAGVFTPTFVIGGIFGRMIGEAIQVTEVVATNFEPFEFAIIGAAAFSTGVTRAISTAVIIMEVSHNGYLTIPVSIAILAAYFTGGRFIENVYDVLITTSRLPRLQKLPKAAYDIPSWEVMKTVDAMAVLSADATYRRAEELLALSKDPVFPIVDTLRSMHLIGAVTRTRLQQAIEYCRIKTRVVPGDDKAKPLMDWRIQFACRRGGHVLGLGTNHLVERTKMTVLVNPSPFTVVGMTNMQRVDTIFRMLKLNNAYVTHCGQLVGVISRARLMQFLSTACGGDEETTKYRIPGVLKHMGHMVSECCPKDRQPLPKDEPNPDDYVAVP